MNPQILKELVEIGEVFFKETSSSFLFDCPKCKKSLLLAIHKKDGYWGCYKCKADGFKGKHPENVLSILYGKPVRHFQEALYGEVQAQLKVDFSLELTDLWGDEMSPDPYDGWDLDPVFIPPHFVSREHPKFEFGRKYLLDQRKLNDEIINHYDIRYNYYNKSVVFPIQYQGLTYGWQERGINSNLKLTMKGLNRSRCLMFYDNLDNSEHAIICEGPVDALRCHYLGGAVAAMGKEVTEYQLELIKEKVEKIYLALDPDAYTVTYKLAKDLMGVCKVYIMEPPSNRKDFGECSFEEAKSSFENASRYFGQSSIKLKGFYG